MAVATYLLDPVISTGIGRTLQLQGHSFTFQAKVSGTGSVTATILVQVSNDQIDWFDLVTFTLSGTTSDADAEAVEAPWAFARGKVTAITGTGATAQIIMGIVP
jgi:hypothetical protein